MHPIIESIENDNFDTFKKLLQEHPEYLKEKDGDGWNLLPLSIQYHMPEYAELLLEMMTKEEINSQEPYHPLIVAFENNSTLVDSLIKNDKVDSNIVSKSGDNLLYYATLFDKKELIPLLIEKGVSPFHTNNLGQSPILQSIEKNDDSSFDLYTKIPTLGEEYDEIWIKNAIKHNAINIFNRLHPYSNMSVDELFDLALGFGQIQIVELILDTGDLIPGHKQITSMIDMMCLKYIDPLDQEAALSIADFLFSINVPFNRFVNSQGESAWMLAVYNDNEAIFEKLIASNETVNITDSQENTPLFYAIQKNNLHFISSVLKKRANVNHVDYHKNTPLHMAVRQGSLEAVQEILTYPNIKVNEVNSANDTPFSICVRMRRMDIAMALIWAGAEITKNPVKFIQDNSVYQIGLSGNYEKAFDSTEEKQIDNFITLASMGLQLSEKNEKGDTLLLHFIKNGYLANFKALLLGNFDGNQIDEDGNSALMCAMRKNSDDYAMNMLWKFRSLDYSVVNKDGETVYDMAADCNSAKRVTSLLNKDPELKQENLVKVLPILALSGKLEDLESLIAPVCPPLDKFVDVHNNNTLMLAALGNNIDNFKWLLKQENFKFNFSAQNKNMENLVDIINKLPEDDALIFTQYLSPHLTNNKKKP